MILRITAGVSLLAFASAFAQKPAEPAASPAVARQLVPKVFI